MSQAKKIEREMLLTTLYALYESHNVDPADRVNKKGTRLTTIEKEIKKYESAVIKVVANAVMIVPEVVAVVPEVATESIEEVNAIIAELVAKVVANAVMIVPEVIAVVPEVIAVVPEVVAVECTEDEKCVCSDCIEYRKENEIDQPITVVQPVAVVQVPQISKLSTDLLNDDSEDEDGGDVEEYNKQKPEVNKVVNIENHPKYCSCNSCFVIKKDDFSSYTEASKFERKIEFELIENIDIKEMAKMFLHPLVSDSDKNIRSLSFTYAYCAIVSPKLKTQYYYDDDNIYKYGRLKAKVSDKFEYEKLIPAVYMGKYMRGACFSRNSHDIDIVNCHPVILQQLNEQRKYKNTPLNTYNKNRDAVLNHFIEGFKIDRKNAKQLFIEMMFGADLNNITKRHNLNQNCEAYETLKEFASAMTANIEFIAEHDDFKEIKKYNRYRIFKRESQGLPTSKNINASTFALILQEQEKKIILWAVRWVNENMKDFATVSAVIYDGFHIDGKMLTDKQMTNMTNYVENKSGFSIQFAKKEFDSKQLEDNLIYNIETFRDPMHYRALKDVWELFAYYTSQHGIVSIRTDKYITESIDCAKFEKLYQDIYLLEKKLNKKGEPIIAEDINGEERYVWKREPFAKKWIKDSYKRKYKEANFYAPPLVCPGKQYINLWEGFEIERIPLNPKKSHEPILNFMRMMLKENEEHFTYLCDWISEIIQSPGKKKPIGIMLYSAGEGCGKNRLTSIIEKMLGQQYSFSSDNPIEQLFGNFSKLRENKLFIVMDEFSAKVGQKNKDAIKNLITETEFVCNAKYQPEYRAPALARYMITTNNIGALDISETNRRFVVFECSNKHRNDTAYFKKLHESIDDNECIRSLFEFFKTRKITQDIVANIPETSVCNTIKECSRSPFTKWLMDLAGNNVEEEPEILQFSDLYKRCEGWIDSYSKGTVINHKRFGMWFNPLYDNKSDSKIAGISLHSNSQNRKKILIDYKTLNESLKTAEIA